MAQPNPSDVHIDRPLTNISIAFLQAQDRFIGTRVFPVVPVGKQSDKYYTFDRNAFLRDEMQVRAPATESAGSGYSVSTDSYSCDEYGLHHDIPDQVRDNADDPLSPDRNGTQFLTQQALQKIERQFVRDFFGTSIWTTDATPASLWSDYAASDPIGDVETGKVTIMQRTGFEPNTLVLGYQVFSKLKNHPDFVDRIKYTSDDVVTAQLMARLFEVERVFVAKAIKATNLEGETAAYDFIYGKHALLCYSNPAPAIEMPSAGYTFLWTGVNPSMEAPIAISRFRLDTRKADRLEIGMAWDNKKVSADLGYFFNGAVA